jgi:hypothetical protein
MIAFIKVRQTWFPVDSIDQIDDIGGRMRVSLSSGIKIDLDPIEAEKVVRQMEAMSTVRDGPDPQVAALMARLVTLEAHIGGLKAHMATVMATQSSTNAAPQRARAKTNA